MTYTVQQLADAANISVRTLHYYDEIGLLKPARIRANGYREYGETELLTLQQILFFRELDVPLEQIKAIMAHPTFSYVGALEMHRETLLKKRDRLNKLLITIDTTMTHITNGTTPPSGELYDAFSDPDVAEYATEAHERWGNTKAYAQSVERVKKMSQHDMDEIKRAMNACVTEIATHMTAGVLPHDARVQSQIATWHNLMNLFYDCSPHMLRQLGDMYVSDPRFRVYYETHATGLAEFINQAIKIYVG